MITIIENQEENSSEFPYVMMLKGAPEKIIAMCDKTFKNGQVHDMSKDDRQAIEDINELLAKRGERVLAFAQL